MPLFFNKGGPLVRLLTTVLLLLNTASAAQLKISCFEPLVEAGWQPAAYNHILEAAEGGYEVLLPLSGQSFKVVRVDSLSRARLLARSIEKPLDLAAMIAARTPDLEELLRILRDFHGKDSAISITARTKEPESLKRKVFNRVKKRGTCHSRHRTHACWRRIRGPGHDPTNAGLGGVERQTRLQAQRERKLAVFCASS
ncbi:MAG: hypothetical protein HY074_19665 [Deltaproteobacteria bacterium]|nr:hypothetical protein [Deltaproteobacteria bacterium]